jgi:hypothetical protein
LARLVTVGREHLGVPGDNLGPVIGAP